MHLQHVDSLNAISKGMNFQVLIWNRLIHQQNTQFIKMNNNFNCIECYCDDTSYIVVEKQECMINMDNYVNAIGVILAHCVN